MGPVSHNIKKDSDKNTQTIENNNDKENASSINSETIDNDDDNWCDRHCITRTRNSREW